MKNKVNVHKISYLGKRPQLLWVVIFFLTLMFWQNCSDIQLEKTEEPLVVASGDNESYLKPPPIRDQSYRAVFILDMSNSMFSGACPDSMDVMVDNVTPSKNCIGPTGVDPEGKRFLAIYKWLEDVEKKVSENKINEDKFKFLILPFSNTNLNRYWTIDYIGPTGRSVKSVFSRAIDRLGMSTEVKPGFISLKGAKSHILLLWAAFSKFHDYPYSKYINREIIEAVDTLYQNAGNTNPSSGTSIVLPALEEMNLYLHHELNSMEESGGRGLFEILFLSDGVPKPHSRHIEYAARYVWTIKDEVHDSTLCGQTVNGYCTGLAKVTGGKNCYNQCSGYLRIYTDTGSVQLPSLESPTCTSYYSIPATCSGYSDGSNPGNRWGSRIKCGQCFTLLHQFDRKSSCSGSSCGGVGDSFSQKTKGLWGDWTQNRHSEIIGKIRSTENIFRRQFPFSTVRLKFLRIDSDNPENQTSPGELITEINWMERAKEYFSKNHQFYHVKSMSDVPLIFSEIGGAQKYKLAMVYAYSRNARSQRDGSFSLDSDGDGLADDQENEESKFMARSDGKCLDSIKKKFGICIDFGCNHTIDADGDGLNQCEEKTLGTDDFNPDSDGDFILDGVELLFGLNPLHDDRKLFLAGDGFSNFEHFVKGVAPSVNIKDLDEEKIMSVQTQFLGMKAVRNELGSDIEVPSYKIEIKNLPLVKISTNSSSRKNEIVVVIRVDDHNNPHEKIWMFNIYKLSEDETHIYVNLSDFKPLALEQP